MFPAKLFRQPNEVLQQLQSHALTFLRVKLSGKDVVLPNGRRKRIAVIRGGGDDAFVRGLRIKAVDEINVAAAFHAAIERAIRARDLDLIPRDLRNFQSGLLREPHDAATKNTESRRATIELLAPLEQRLIAHADAEKRFAGLDEIARGFEQLLLAESVDAIVERANAGQHDGLRAAHPFRVLHDLHVCTDLEQRLVDAAQVARTVIKQSNHAHTVKERLRFASRCKGCVCHSRWHGVCKGWGSAANESRQQHVPPPNKHESLQAPNDTPVNRVVAGLAFHAGSQPGGG